MKMLISLELVLPLDFFFQHYNFTALMVVLLTAQGIGLNTLYTSLHLILALIHFKEVDSIFVKRHNILMGKERAIRTPKFKY